ncbi:phosphotransferase [Kitasatospora sp. NPDC056181]|uniref:phosphotransferase n=1 Tax=Kitasatospora sp. NPDC056181 TaxID=3345737 RepID=UPI0035DE08F7
MPGSNVHVQLESAHSADTRHAEAQRRVTASMRARIKDAVRKALRGQGISGDIVIRDHDLVFHAKGATEAAACQVTAHYGRGQQWTLWVKLGTDDLVNAEASGAARLQAHFGKEHVIDILHEGDGVIVLPFLEGHRSVEELINSGDRDSARSAWKNFWGKETGVWHLTKNPEGDYGRTSRRLSERTVEAYRHFPEWKEYARLPMTVNQVRFPSLETLQRKALDLLRSRPPALVMAHGDENPANVMVQPGRESEFVLIDLGNAGYMDAAYSVAKAVHYVLSYVSINKLKVLSEEDRRQRINVAVRSGRLAIDYDLDPLPPGSRELADIAIAAGKHFSEWEEDQLFGARLAAAAFVCLWGGAPHHKGYPDLVPVLVGEAAQLSNDLYLAR